MEYKALYFKLKENSSTLNEIIIAELYSIGFEGFLETEKGVVGYIPAKDYDKTRLKKTNFYNNPLFKKMVIKEEFILERNWNELWENNYEPVFINNQCCIKAPFHKNVSKYKYEILIEPKMSFGTGHHETTSLMIEEILELNVEENTVLDMGCGTGILAILASKKGAEHVTAIDINEWAYENTIENCRKNNIDNVSIQKGDANLITNKRFDIILANIQRNILIHDTNIYQSALKPDGLLIMSGINKSDLPEIEKECFKYSLKYVSFKEKNNWVSVKFRKI